MELLLDEYEIDTLMETLQYRIENDEHLLTNASLKSDLKDLIDRLEEDYWYIQHHCNYWIKVV